MAYLNGQEIPFGVNAVIINGDYFVADSELSETSENPVQNKVITAVLNEAAEVITNLGGSVTTLQTGMGEYGKRIEALEQGGGATITVDSELSDTSENPVQNKVITEAVSGFTEMINQFDEDIADHQNRIRALEQDGGITVDSEFSDTSENPVQNKVITAAIVDAQQVLQNLAGTIPTDAHINSLIDAKLGDIESALDSIIAVQNALIGGDA